MPSADRLYERMRRSKAGWRFRDLRRLYLGFGFEAFEGGNHTMFIHPKYTQLRATVARHRSLAEGYVTHAVNLIATLKQLEEGQENA